MDEQIVRQILTHLDRIALALETLARAGAPAEPNYIKPLSDYREFDWESINASVVQQDADGPTHLEWGGALWTRRSPSNKFEPAIWYSRASGKDDEGNVSYLRLITFRQVKDADPIPERTAAAAHTGSTNGKANGKSDPQQARIPTGKTGPLGKLSPWDAFEAQAIGLKLHPQAAARIAALYGLETTAKDFSGALSALQYFGHAKRLGLDWAAALAILQESVMDTDKAGQILDKQHTPPGK